MQQKQNLIKTANWIFLMKSNHDKQHWLAAGSTERKPSIWAASFMEMWDTLQSSGTQWLIKRENPDLKIHNAFPCDLCVYWRWHEWAHVHKHPHANVCAHSKGSVPNCCLNIHVPISSSPFQHGRLCLSAAPSIPGIFCGLWAVGAGREGV